MKKIVFLFFIFMALLLLASCASTSQSTAQSSLVPQEAAPPPPPDPESIPGHEPISGPEPVPDPDQIHGSVPESIPESEPEPDIAGPELQVRLSSQYFSPDNDGTDDKLKIYLSAFDESGLGHWSFEIREPGASNRLFYRWEGDGAPPAELIWDGRSADGELVQSAEAYPYTFSVSNSLGNVSDQKGSIQVDVMAVREKDPFRVARDRFRAQVPSIVFASDSGGFEGLDAETLANNDWTLRRIALILNRFSTYQVEVEGHANITAEGAEAQQREKQELQALSELRAKTVVDYLDSLGIDRSRMTYTGIGGSRPIAAYEDRDNWWKNRRVEFLLAK